MSEEKSFLKVLKERDVDFNFRMLTEDGYEGKLKIPVDWFYSKEITKEDFVKALEEFVMQAVLKRGKLQGEDRNKTLEKYEFNANKRTPGKSCIDDFEIKKDENGNVYLLVTGLDNYTKVAIHQDDEDIKGKGLYRVRESKFIEKLKEISDKRKVEEFIQKNGGSINVENLDMRDFYRLFEQIHENDLTDSFTQAGRNIARYATYIRKMQEDMGESVILCEVAEETVGIKRPRGNKPSATSERVNEIIDSKDRFDFLNSLDPEYTIKVNPIRTEDSNKKFEFQAYTYDLNKRNKGETGTMIVIEPENGMRRTRIVYVSQKDIDNIKNDLTAQGEKNVDKKRVYEQVIADTLGKTSSQIVNERRIQQTNHTTIEAFKACSKYFILGEKEDLINAISDSNMYKKIQERKEMTNEDR